MPFHQKHSKTYTFQDTLSLGYPCRFIKSTRNRQLFRIPSHFGNHLVTPKELKIFNFSGYPLTFVSMWFHQKHSKSSTFQDILSRGYPSPYTKSTKNSQLFSKKLTLGYTSRFIKSIQNRELFRKPSRLGIHVVKPKALQITQFFWIYSHLGVHVVTPKALKILNFSSHPVALVSISFPRKHSIFSTFWDILSFRYPSRFIKSTRNRELFRIPSHLRVHVVSSKAFEIVDFSRYALTWVSISLHQKHSKLSNFMVILSVRYTLPFIQSTRNRQLFTTPSHLGIHLVKPKALKVLNFSG